MSKIFRTELHLKPGVVQLSHRNPVFTMGSCFADAIGKKLADNKFATSINPLGTLYSPLSIHKALQYVIHNELPHGSGYVESHGTWCNYDFHSSLSAMNRGDLEKKISEAIGSAHYALKDADILLLTYGTAKVYYRIDNNEPVANCHKVDGKQFNYQLVTPETIRETFADLYKKLKTWKPSLRIILTVSPVRHLKDTLELNSVSKSILRLVCHQLEGEFADVEYFPAYELVMDDLRDYRFYEPDMIHPSSEAIDYIWGKFGDRYFNTETRKVMKQWQDVSAGLQHRPFHPNSAGHRRFLEQTLRQLEELKGIIRVDEEIGRIKLQLL